MGQSLDLSIHLKCIAQIENLHLNMDSYTGEPHVSPSLNKKANLLKQNHTLLREICDLISSKGAQLTYSQKLILDISPGKTLQTMMSETDATIVAIKPRKEYFEHLSLGSVTLDILKIC